MLTVLIQLKTVGCFTMLYSECLRYVIIVSLEVANDL